MLNKVPWLMSAENICHQPKRFKTADAAEKLAHPRKRRADGTIVQDTDKKQKQSKNMYMYSQELPNSLENISLKPSQHILILGTPQWLQI